MSGQLGLEPTPEQYIASLLAVFVEVWRVLRDDGTCWVNLGDSYAAGGKGGGGSFMEERRDAAWQKRSSLNGWRSAPDGMKAKDLVGIPWAFATAMRAPFYTGRIPRERDRVWLAAMIDTEGSICGFDHIRNDDNSPRTGLNITITNSSVPLLDEALRIWPASKNEHCVPGDGHLGTVPTFRWIVHGIENKMALLQDVYPHLIAKRKQAVLAYSLCLLMADAKRLGHTAQRDEIRAKRSKLVAEMSRANHGQSPDVPEWCTEPPSLFSPGWYLRSDIVWSKPNPMPESCEDRPTKAHEYIFLLTKKSRYYYDADAIAEPVSDAMLMEVEQGYDGLGLKDYAAAGVQNPSSVKARIIAGARDRWDRKRKETERSCQQHREDREPNEAYFTRNKRSVWTVATQPYSGAHFATMPEAIVEPCILAGSRFGNLILDPFSGSGTVGAVAERLGRRWVGTDLNPAYHVLAKTRTAQRGLRFETAG